MNGRPAKADNRFPGSESAEGRDKYLTFFCDGQTYGISVYSVIQIIGVRPITKIPDAPYYSKGVVELRGSVIPVADMRLRIGAPEAECSEHACIIITDIQGSSIGFAVDGVDEVIRIGKNEISDPPPLAGTCENEYIFGIGNVSKGMILLLDVDRLLNKEQIQQLQDA